MNTPTQLRPWHAVLGLAALILSVVVLTGDVGAAPSQFARTHHKAHKFHKNQKAAAAPTARA